MRIIAVHTSKGGVGKTTLVVNIAYELAKRSNKILVIDLDDQANASLSLGVNRADELDRVSSLHEFQKVLNSFKERSELIDFLIQCDLPDFDYRKYVKPSSLNQDLSGKKGLIDVIPSSYRTRDDHIRHLIEPQSRLFRAIYSSEIVHNYDYVIIDTSPSLTDITKSGLMAAQYLLMPTQFEYLSAYGVTSRLEDMMKIRQHKVFRGEMSAILGIVPMMTQKRSRLNTMIKNILKNQIEGEDIPILSEIHQSDSIRQASHKRKPVSLIKNQKSIESAAEFSTLTEDILRRISLIESSGEKA